MSKTLMVSFAPASVSPDAKFGQLPAVCLSWSGKRVPEKMPPHSS